AMVRLGKLQSPSGSEKPGLGNGFPDTLPSTPFCQAVLEAQ
ncbi:12551_t:CDS:2, partial [Funneliformis geosporum]